jgi:hypothetical protein
MNIKKTINVDINLSLQASAYCFECDAEMVQIYISKGLFHNQAEFECKSCLKHVIFTLGEE